MFIGLGAFLRFNVIDRFGLLSSVDFLFGGGRFGGALANSDTTGGGKYSNFLFDGGSDGGLRNPDTGGEGRRDFSE